MTATANIEIREAAKRNGVFLWQVAEHIGVNDGNLSRKLRHELPADEKEQVLNIIHQIAAEKRGVS